MKKIFFLLLAPFFCFAQLPDYYPYYNNIDFSKTGNALKEQLATLITQTHVTQLTYTPDVWAALKSTDLDPENMQNVLLIYGYDDNDADTDNDRTRDKDLSCHTTSCNGLWVREHVFPRSLGNPNLEYAGPGSDAHHLRCIDSNMNSSRSNRRFADGSGQSATLPGTMFYPGDEWKGDVARMMMYMYVRYNSRCEANVVGSGSSSYSTFFDMPNIFLEWNTEDPVSIYEMNRNNILEDIQGNRNPFIDNPYIATMIWNGPSAEDTWGTLIQNIYAVENMYAYPTLTNGMVHLENLKEGYTINVYNYLGQRINTGINQNSVDLTGNVAGMYFIEISDTKYSKTIKVILQ